jgi:hypothetical protein
MNWEKCICTTTKIRVNNVNAKYIIERIGSILPDFYKYNDKKRTILIKETLSLLGDAELVNKCHYNIYGNGLSEDFIKMHEDKKFINREWLYDLEWYTENEGGGKNYMIKTFPLAVECEWGRKRKGDKNGDNESEIKYDFQKLLVCNAELRLMIFQVRNNNREKLDKYFEEAINNYIHLKAKSSFLFIAFDKKIKGFYYTLYRKNKKGIKN